MLNVKKLSVSLVSILTLSLGSISVNAAYNSEYNSSALEAFGVSESDLDSYLDAIDDRSSFNQLDYYYGAGDWIDLFEQDVMTTFGHSIYIGRAYPSDVNNAIQVKYDRSFDGFIIKQSGGSNAVDVLFLSYVRQLGDVDMMYEMYNSKGDSMKQPTVTVNGDNIDFYIPYVYYNKGTREYIAKQISNKLEVLTGKEFNVKFRTSDLWYVKAIDGRINEPIYNINTIYFIEDMYAGAGYNVDIRVQDNGLPTYTNGNYYSNADYVIIDHLGLRGFLNVGSETLFGTELWGIERTDEITVLTHLVRNLFYSADVDTIVFSDYTITLRAGRYLEIQPR